jgi:hypothetical protein
MFAFCILKPPVFLELLESCFLTWLAFKNMQQKFGQELLDFLT